MPPASRAAYIASSSNATSSYCNDDYYGGGGGGCFGPNATVQVDLAGERITRLVKDVRKGDKLVVADGTATVLCAVSIDRDPSKRLVSLPGGLTITGGHPIRIDGEWKLPREIETAVAEANTSGKVYNFVLDRSHVVLVNGIECITWGHGLTDPVVKHSYFGTSQIISDLSQFSGWHSGFV